VTKRSLKQREVPTKLEQVANLTYHWIMHGLCMPLQEREMREGWNCEQTPCPGSELYDGHQAR